MKMRRLLMGLLIAGVSGSAAAMAAGEPIELKVQDSGIGVVQVDGPDGGTYTEVLNDTIEYFVSVRGTTPYSAIEGTSQLKLRLVPHGEDREFGQISEVWKTYKLSMPYHDLPTISSVPISPIKLCKERLNETSGAARQDFMNKGVTFTESVLWKALGTVNWDRYGGHPDKDETTTIPLTLKIQCLALNRMVSKLRIEPAKVTQLGKFLCPMELKLHGFMSSRDEFNGKSLFVGPYYLSAITPLQLDAGDNRNMSATYKMNWRRKTDALAVAPNVEPKKQKLTFRFNISDQAGKVVESVEKTIEVSCKKIKVNAPTTGDGMTVNPAN
jgi:hypothetical protein